MNCGGKYRGLNRGLCCFFFQAEGGIRELVRSRGLGDVYKRQHILQTNRAPCRTT